MTTNQVERGCIRLDGVFANAGQIASVVSGLL